MNKYQASFKSISDNQYQYGSDEDWELMEELVDKETPKKVEKHRPLENDVKIGNATFKKGTSFLSKCPVCGKFVHKRYHKNYCGNCGQKLDWEE